MAPTAKSNIRGLGTIPSKPLAIPGDVGVPVGIAVGGAVEFVFEFAVEIVVGIAVVVAGVVRGRGLQVSQAAVPTVMVLPQSDVPDMLGRVWTIMHASHGWADHLQNGPPPMWL